MANSFYVFTALTGGTSGALDDLIHTNISDGDIALVTIKSTEKKYIMYYDSSSSTAEDTSADQVVVQPDSNSGNGRWIQVTQDEMLWNNTSKILETISTGIQAAVAAFDIKTSGGEDGITINNNGAVEVFHNNTKVLNTTTEGVETVGGVKFPATQNASSDANTLDDYEEGTWTPTAADAASGGNTGTTGTGTYTKIGRLVFASGYLGNIDTSGMTSSNAFHIQGLPIASLAGIDITIGNSMWDTLNFNATNSHVVSAVIASESAIRFFEIRDNSTERSVLVSDLTTGTSDVWFNITYITS